MQEVLKPLGLTHLAQVLPTVLEEARQQQLSYEAFLRRALQSKSWDASSGRWSAACARPAYPRRRAWKRLIFPFSRPSLSAWCAN